MPPIKASARLQHPASFPSPTDMPKVSSHDPTAPLPSDLSKLNVSQLRALCKQRRIVGYSKLGKAALISKLAELTPNSLPTPPSSVHNTRSEADASSSTSDPPPLDNPPAHAGAGSGSMGPPSLPISRGRNMVSGTHILQSSVTSDAFQPPPCPSGGRGKRLSPSVASHNGPISKHGPSEISQACAYPLAKRPRVAAPSAVQAREEATLRLSDSARLPGDCDVPGSPLSGSPGSALVPGIKINEGLGPRLDSQTQTVSMSRNRFKPLTITRPPSVTQCSRKEAQPSSGSLLGGSASVMAQPTLLWHLDFPAPPDPPLLSAITYPPPLSQRKLVQAWVIILSGLSCEERLQCCSVSRLIRYAGKRGC